MSDIKRIEIETKDITFGTSATIKETRTVSFEVECYNEDSQMQSIRCPLEANHRNIDTLKDIGYPFLDFNLLGYNTDATLSIIPKIRDIISDSIPVLPSVDILAEYGQSVYDQLSDEEKEKANKTLLNQINFQGNVNWEISNNTLISKLLSSSAISENDFLTVPLPGETCQKFKITDSIHTLEIPYTAISELRMYLNNQQLQNDEIISSLNEILPRYGIDVSNGKVSFRVDEKILIRFLQSTMEAPIPIKCKTIDQSEEPEPEIIYLSQNRYAISINSANGFFYLDNLGLSDTQWKSIINYPNKKIYADLVLKDNCFKMWLLIPVGWVLFIPILLPFWFDVSIFNFALNILVKVIQALVDYYINKLEMARQIANNISVQNLVKMGKQAVAITKALINGDLNDELLGVLKNVARIGKELIDTVTDQEELKRIIDEVARVMLKIGGVIVDVTDFLDPTKMLDKIKVGSLELIKQTFETFKAIIVSILEVVNDIIKLIQSLPDNVVTRHLKKIVNALDILAKTVIKFVEDVKNYGESLLEKIDFLAIPQKVEELDLINKIISLSDKVINAMDTLIGSISSFNINIDLSIFDEIIGEIKEKISAGEVEISSFIDSFKEVITNFMSEESFNEVKGTISEEGIDEEALIGIVISKLATPLLGEEIANYIKDFISSETISDERLDYLLNQFIGSYVSAEVLTHIRIIIKEYLNYKQINKESFKYLLQYFLGSYLSIELINHIQGLVIEEKVDMRVLVYDTVGRILKQQDASNKTIFKEETNYFFKALDEFNTEPLINRVKELLDIRNADAEFLKSVLEDLGVKQLGLAALDKAEKHKQSDVEKAIEEKALEVAASADAALQEGIKVLKLRELEALAFEYIYITRALLDQALGMVQDVLIGRPEQEKRRIISNLIQQVLNKDMYQISRFGRFDPKNPEETQLIINDIDGVKIISKSGNILWNSKKLCNLPFINVGTLSSHGCNARNSLKGIEVTKCQSDWNCKGKEFWFDYIKRKVSFNFMNNHNLAIGGIRIGDFDGDGIDDIWCYAPTTTKGSSTTKNNIVFSPLNKNYNYTISQEAWCPGGNILVGDFNGDKKDDSLCITSSNFYLLHGGVGSFIPAINNQDGLLSLGSLITGWDHTKKIIVADIDGDMFSDLIKIERNTIDILFGHKDKYFITRPDITQKFIENQDEEKIELCQAIDINRIIVGDLNHDKREDIVCIPSKNAQPVILYAPDLSDSVILSSIDINRRGYESTLLAATTAGATNPKKNVIIVIEDVKLQPLINNAEFSTNFDSKHKSINNQHYGGQSLLSYYETGTVTKVVSDISYDFDCFNTVDYNLDVSIALKDSYEIPEYLVSPWSNKLNIRTVNFEASAQWSNNKLINLYSSNIINFGNLIDGANGLKYNASITRAITTVNVNYIAKAKIYIEEDQRLLNGQELKEHAKTFLSLNEVNDDDNSVFIPISGHIVFNMLDFGYHDVKEGN